ncbi:MAG TPA: hypothetical protein VNG13_11310 [Mycobacteriales bacterium]|nr:hypothetical protein [Mycobacteriales bacterium]
MTATTHIAPSGIRLATPGDWFEVPTSEDPSEIARQVDALVVSRPGLEGQREVLTGLLGVLGATAAASRALCVRAVLVDAPGGQLPAFLMASIGEAPAGGVAAIPGEDASWLSRTFDLPMGPTVRLEGVGETPRGADGGAVAVSLVQYHAAVPSTDRLLSLVFFTPALGLMDTVLREIFHGIACSVEFEADNPDPEGTAAMAPTHGRSAPDGLTS